MSEKRRHRPLTRLTLPLGARQADEGGLRRHAGGQETANFTILMASKFCTPPPTRFVT